MRVNLTDLPFPYDTSSRIAGVSRRDAEPVGASRLPT
jgi:hypothetical protein